jgi:DNA-binding response OmpR family regulator
MNMADNGNILFADDDQIFLYAASLHLTQAGFTCTLCHSAAEVINALQNGHYDILISDIQMPGNESLQLVKQLQELNPAPPVVLVTGYPSLETAVPSVSLPVAAYLVKPVSMDELERVIKSILPRSRMAYSLVETRRHLDEWQTELDQLIAGLKLAPAAGVSLRVDDYIQLVTRNIITSLYDIQAVTSAGHSGRPLQAFCDAASCARNQELTAAIKEAIKVLQETKNAFKSTELAGLRKKLESMLS